MRKYVVTFALLVVLVFAAGVQAGYYDFGGATITILGQSGNPAERFIEGVGQDGVGTAYGLHLEAEQLFNCKIEFGVYSFLDYVEGLMTRLLSGDSEYDMWFMNNHQYWALLSMGAFFPVSDVVSPDYFENLPGMARGAAEYMSAFGATYGFGTAWNNIGGLAVIAYNPDFFERMGLPDLQELYFDGEWTWDALAEIGEAVATDDRYGIVGMGRMEYVYPFAYTNNYAALISEVDGRFTFTGSESGWIDSISTIVDWIERGIASSSSSNTNNPMVAREEAAMALTSLNRLRQLDGENYRIVPLPMGPGMDYHVHGSAYNGALVLPANSREPEGMVQLAEFLYPEEDYRLVVEDVIMRYAQDRTSAQILNIMHDEWSGHTGSFTQRGEALWPAIEASTQALAGQRPIASGMAEVEAGVQAALDEAFNW